MKYFVSFSDDPAETILDNFVLIYFFTLEVFSITYTLSEKPFVLTDSIKFYAIAFS